MIIVTGAAGFIGSCLVKELNLQGHTDIICVDRLGEDDKWMNLRGLEFRNYVHADDFIEEEVLMSYMDEGVDAVYHMGACSSTTERDMDYLMYNNVNYSKAIFQACADYDVPLCYASSAATYGDGQQGYRDDHKGLEELMPMNAYGYSKHLVDRWALKQSEAPSRWYGVKFFNVYGPNEYHKGPMSSVIYQSYQKIQKQGKIELFESHRDGVDHGDQKRDFVYVKDIARAMVSLINDSHDGENGIYNLGTGEADSFLNLAKATFAALEKPENIEFIPMPEHLRDQYQYFTQADMSKFHRAFPKFEFCKLQEGVKDYVQSHLMSKNPHL